MSDQGFFTPAQTATIETVATRLAASHVQELLAELYGNLSVSIPVAGRAFGLTPNGAYAVAKRGEFPVKIVKVGGVFRCASADLLKVLGLPPISIPEAPTAPE
jgi:hypothetical protein